MKNIISFLLGVFLTSFVFILLRDKNNKSCGSIRFIDFKTGDTIQENFARHGDTILFAVTHYCYIHDTVKFDASIGLIGSCRHTKSSHFGIYIAGDSIYGNSRLLDTSEIRRNHIYVDSTEGHKIFRVRNSLADSLSKLNISQNPIRLGNEQFHDIDSPELRKTRIIYNKLIDSLNGQQYENNMLERH